MQALRTARWILQATLAAALVLPFAASAKVECEAPDARGVQRCKAGLDDAQIRQIQRTQEKSQWCWAASIAMVFAHHGFTVTQEQVVRRQFADLADKGINGAAISQMLSRGWKDGAGRVFYTATAVADPYARRFEIANQSLVREMAEERPMIFGAEGHAMVLVQVEFERTGAEGAPRIVGGTVIDPAPGKGVRTLQRQEMRPHYLAAVQPATPEQIAAAGGSVAAE
jgi:hypothetical protein